MVRPRFRLAIAVALWLGAATVRAEDSAPPTPSLHHAPVSVTEAHAPLVIPAEIVHPDLVRRALLVYRGKGGDWLETPFRRGSPGPYTATIPRGSVAAPYLDYAIELESTDGHRIRSFASRVEPHRVLVPEDLEDMRERALVERLHGRRSVVSTSGEFVRFGDSPAVVRDPSGTTTTRNIADQYYRIEGAYTYRPLRLVSEFSIRLGVVRGRSPVPGVDNQKNFDVGLNYAAPSVRFRLADLWHFEALVLTSVTEVGFSLGGGGALHIGDPYGSKLVVGFESIEVFGTRVFSRVDVRTGDRLTLSPIVEATNMPHADSFGIRLLGEASFAIGGGFSAQVRGGYQAREATSGGPSAGLGAAWAF